MSGMSYRWIRASGGIETDTHHVPARIRSFEKSIDDSFRLARKTIGQIARRRVLAVCLVAVLSLVLSAAISIFVHWPQPEIHDEFSYLLAADTFAHGRLSNPTHPLWVHFESFHVIQQPTYVSKYPPGQGLALAAGQVFFGHPVAGVWLTAAIASGAICWMLVAWVPPRWALLGSLLAVIHPTLRSWGQSYWGGSVALLGGALLLGAARRTVKKPSIRDSVLMGLGLIILVNSRPYEGSVLGFLVMMGLLIWMIGRSGPSCRCSLQRILVPLSVVVGIGACGMAYYNFRTTGGLLRFPYLVHEGTYGVAPFFLWQQPRAMPSYHHHELQEFHEEILEQFLKMRDSRAHVLGFLARKTLALLLITQNAALSFVILPVLIAPWVIKNGTARLVLLLVCIIVLSTYPVSWTQSHYFAPAFGLIFILVVQVIRILRTWRWQGGRTGRLVTRALLPLYIILSLSPALPLPSLPFRHPCTLQMASELASWRLSMKRKART